jgi:hypothetical protein
MSVEDCHFRKFHPAEIRMVGQNRRIIAEMFAILHALGMFVADLFKSRSRLEAENVFLRHQLNVALRRAQPRPLLHGSDRALLVSSDLALPSWCGPGRSTGDHFALAPRWLSRLLAAEVAK